MGQTFESFMKSRAKKPEKKFQEYAPDWESSPKKKKRSSTDISDSTGGKDLVIKSTGAVQSGIGEKRKQTTRIRRTEEPRTGTLPFKKARKRRKTQTTWI